MNAAARNILFFPDLPSPRTIMFQICAHIGCGVTNVPEEAPDVAFKWRDATWHSLDAQANRRLQHLKVFNSNCVDISKRRVAQCFEDVFGRPLSVDPIRHSGLMVCKSDRNAAHDGVVLQGPIDLPAPDKIYSVLVDNSEGSEVVDIRVPIMLGRVPFVYVKRRPEHRRFANKNANVVMAMPDGLLTKDELDLIRLTSSCLGMDYGELDVLRDRRSSDIYIVDANNTPFGPPNGLSAADAARAVEALSIAFAEVFLIGGASSE